MQRQVSNETVAIVDIDCLLTDRPDEINNELIQILKLAKISQVYITTTEEITEAFILRTNELIEYLQTKQLNCNVITTADLDYNSIGTHRDIQDRFGNLYNVANSKLLKEKCFPYYDQNHIKPAEKAAKDNAAKTQIDCKTHILTEFIKSCDKKVMIFDSNPTIVKNLQELTRSTDTLEVYHPEKVQLSDKYKERTRYIVERRKVLCEKNIYLNELKSRRLKSDRKALKYFRNEIKAVKDENNLLNKLTDDAFELEKIHRKQYSCLYQYFLLKKTCETYRDHLNKEKLKKPNDTLVENKLKIINKMVLELLHYKNNPKAALWNVKSYLTTGDNQKILTERRDKAYETFFKVVATVLTLGLAQLIGNIWTPKGKSLSNQIARLKVTEPKAEPAPVTESKRSGRK